MIETLMCAPFVRAWHSAKNDVAAIAYPANSVVPGIAMLVQRATIWTTIRTSIVIIKNAAIAPLAKYRLSKNRQTGFKYFSSLGPNIKQIIAKMLGKIKSQTQRGSPRTGDQSRIMEPKF